MDLQQQEGDPVAPTKGPDGLDAVEGVIIRRRRWAGAVEILIVIVLITCVTIVILALMGPAIGNVFSGVMTGNI